MLKVRIIPTLLSKQGQLVKGRGFAADRVVGHVRQAALIHQTRGVDELIILDVTASKLGRPPDYVLMADLTETCFMPITIGGGVTSLDHVTLLMRAGADKVAIGKAAFTNQRLIYQAAHKYGAQAITVTVDAPLSGMIGAHHALWWAREFESSGAGEIIIQSTVRDGTMAGYDLDLIRLVAGACTVPVVASGGCRDVEDMAAAVHAGASALAIGALFQFTALTPKQAAIELAMLGVPTRVEAA